MNDYRTLIDKLNMMAHPEGGFYRRNWQSLLTADIKDNIGKVQFPNRVIGSSILYLLPETMVCKWHRVKCDEMWHHYRGTSLKMYMLTQKGLETIILGSNISSGETPQFLIPRNTWFAAELIEPKDYALCGCTLWPAFSYTDFELAETESLTDDYPAYKELIERIQNHEQ